MAVVKPGQKPAAAATKPAATATKATTPAKPVAAGPAVASMLPDDMLQGGLKDDFDGVIIKVRAVPWDYNGNLDHHVLAAAVTIQPDDEDQPFVQHYSMGDLDNFVPSMDGQTPVDLENGEGEALEGVFALRVGKKEQLSMNSNWAEFVTKAIEANFPKSLVNPNMTFFEGTHAHFNRVPQKKRSGIVSQVTGEGANANRPKEILVITEVHEAPSGTAEAEKPKPVAAPKATTTAKPAAPAAAASTGGDIDQQIVDAILPVIAEGGEEGTPKAKVTAAVMAAFTGAAKAKALKRVQDAAFLEGSDQFAYDPDSATFYAV